MRYSPDGSLIAVGIRGTNRVVVLNAVTHATLADIQVGPGPADLAFTANGALLLVANAGSGTSAGTTVTAINVPGFSVAATITVGSGPSRIGIRPDGAHAYVLNRREANPANRVSVIDLSTLTVITSLNVGALPHSIAFSTDGTRAIVTSVSPGVIHVIDTVAQAVTATFSTLPAPTGVVFRPGLHEAVVANAGGGGPACGLVNTDVPAAVHGLGPFPARTFMAMHPDGTRVYALASARESLTVLDPASGDTLDWGLLWEPDEVDIGPDLGMQVLDVAAPAAGPSSVITADPGGSLLRWDTATDELVGSMEVGDLVKALDASPDGLHVVASAGESVIIADVGQFTPLGGPIVLPDPPEPSNDPCPAIWVPPNECNYNVVVLEDDGLSDEATSLVLWTRLSPPGRQLYEGRTHMAIKRFYDVMPDIFDYVVVLYSSDFRDHLAPPFGKPIDVYPQAGGNANHEWTRNLTRGIGWAYSPAGPRWGEQAGANVPPLATRRLQSRINMNDLGEYDEDFMAFGGRPGVSIFAHELGHRFAAFADILPDNQRFLRRDQEHWSPVFNSFGSAIGGLYGSLLRETVQPGVFTVDAVETTYGPWDEYLMGFVNPGDVPDSFKILDPDPWQPRGYQVGDVITGQQFDVNIDDVIFNEGPRTPSHHLSQRVFHVGVCLVIPKDDPVCVTEVQRAHIFADAVAEFWRTETEV